jgi:hypothetical protein
MEGNFAKAARGEGTVTERTTWVPEIKTERLGGGMGGGGANTIIDVAGVVGERHENTAHSDDDAMSIAGASLWYSVAYMVVFLVVTGCGAGFVWWFVDDIDTPLLVLGALLVWGCASYLILGYNREQGLHHSPSGIAHAEIKSREEVAHHAIDAHIYLLEKRWEREDGSGTVHQITGR